MPLKDRTKRLIGQTDLAQALEILGRPVTRFLKMYVIRMGFLDGLPGLVLDRYHDVLVGQIATAGMEMLRGELEAAIVEVLVTKTIRAAKRLRVRCVTASGGVTCNHALRRRLLAACEREHFTLGLAEPSLCTDNAAMIGILAERKMLHGETTSLDAEIEPGMALE